MLIQSLRPQTFSQVVGNQLNNKLLMALAHNPENAPSTILLQGHFGCGKAIDVDSVLPTPLGKKRAGDIQVGDTLFDNRGKPTTVLGVYPQGLLDSYRVNFEDGRVVYCNSQHLWNIINPKTLLQETVTLQTIIEQTEKTHRKAIIPLSQPVEYPIRSLPIPPYSLGLLLVLAEYCSTGTLLYPNSNRYYLQELKEEVGYLWQPYTSKSFVFPTDSTFTPITPQTFYTTVYKEVVEDRVIPSLYLFASIKQRWELLQGIMDACGTVSNDNNIFCHTPTTSLTNSIRELALSLGLVVTKTSNYSLHFKAGITALTNLFKNRSVTRSPFNRIDQQSLAIISIEKEEKQRDMVCFTVNSPSHLYLCNDYIVTHNTTSARLFAKALNCKNLKANDICGKCENCKADLNCVPWYNEFDSSMLGVDNIREMRDVLLTNSRSYNKVVILDEAHLLSKSSLSALLKVFEESPKGIFYLLATTDPDKLLPTIRSRSLELVFTTKTQGEVRADVERHSKELGLNLSQATIDIIVTRSKGIMRNAHMLLDKVKILGEQEFLEADTSTIHPLYNFLVSILKSDRQGVLEAVTELSRLPVTYLKDDYQEFFLSLIRASIDLNTTQEEKIKKLAGAIPKQQLATLVRTCTQDWVIKSFQSSTQAQAALLSLFQMLSK